MSVIVRGMEMPKECGECRWFHFHGETCTTPKYYLDARCELVESGQDWYGKDSRGGWIGKSISHLPGYGDRYTDEHCVEIGSRASDCPLVEVPEKHGRLIDADRLLAIIQGSADVEHEVWTRYDDEVAFGAMNAYGRVIEVIKHMKGENPCDMCRFTFYEKEGMSDE